LISFITALKTISRTGMALMMRPAQSIFFEVGPAVAADWLIAGLCVAELMNFPPRCVIEEDFSGGRPDCGRPPQTETLGRLLSCLLAVHYPRDPELIDKHPKARRPERLLDWHLHCTVLLQFMEDALGFGWVLDGK